MNALETLATATDATPSGSGHRTTLRAMRAAARVLSVVAPPLASRLAERLWFTPPRPTIRPHVAARLDGGERAPLLVNGCAVTTWTWGEGPLVVLVHGWGGFAAQMHPFVDPLVAAGYRVVAFDAPGHGSSELGASGSRMMSLIDFADVLRVLVARDGQPHAVVAHSGGCTAMGFAMRQGLAPSRVVWLAPMASPDRYARMFGETLGFPDAVMASWRSRAERRLGFRWDDLDMTRLPALVRTPPALVVHDRDDRETTWDEGASIARTWPAAELHTTSGLGHRRILRDAEVIDRVTAFVAGAQSMRTALEGDGHGASTRATLR